MGNALFTRTQVTLADILREQQATHEEVHALVAAIRDLIVTLEEEKRTQEAWRQEQRSMSDENNNKP